MNRVKMSYERKLSLLFKSLFLFGLMMLPSFASSAWAQSVSLSISSIEKVEEKGFVVKGTVTASGMNPKGQIVESDRVSVNVDIKKEPGSVYQELPESTYLRKPAGCESSYTKGKKCMTLKQERGVDILVHGIASMSMRNEPVWRAYGGLGEWHKNAPASVTKAFEGVIPFNILHKGKQVQIEGKQLRIRATLRHELGGPYANWAAFSYHHNIAFEGILQAGNDEDKDGVPDDKDDCPDTCPGLAVDEKGCPDSKLVFEKAYERLCELEKEWQGKVAWGRARADTKFSCLWKLLGPVSKEDPQGQKINSEDKHRLKDKFEKTHEYYNSPEGKHMERVPNTATNDFYCHDYAWHLWRKWKYGTRKVEPKEPGSKETSDGLPITDFGRIDVDRIMKDPGAYKFKEIRFHGGVYRELRPGDVIVYSDYKSVGAYHSAVVNSNRFTGDPDDVICLSKCENDSIFKHALGKVGDQKNYIQKSYASKGKIRIFRPVPPEPKPESKPELKPKPKPKQVSEDSFQSIGREAAPAPGQQGDDSERQRKLPKGHSTKYGF